MVDLFRLLYPDTCETSYVGFCGGGDNNRQDGINRYTKSRLDFNHKECLLTLGYVKVKGKVQIFDKTWKTKAVYSLARGPSTIVYAIISQSEMKMWGGN